MLEEIWFYRLRSGKGDHTIYARGEERVALDGSPNQKMRKGMWESFASFMV